MGIDKRSVFLSVGIANLLLSYVLFTGQQYFSLIAMLGIVGISIIGLVMILMLYYYNSEKKGLFQDNKLTILLALSLASFFLLAYEAYYDLLWTNISNAISYNFFIVAAATIIFVFSLYQIRLRVKISKGPKYYALAFILLLILSNVAYSIQAYRSLSTNWIGTDEIAFNYFASYLFAHGINPYTASMGPILVKYNLYPTFAFNGSCECSYDYPALSFMLPAIFALFSQAFLYAIIFATMVLITFVTFFIYKKSGGSAYMLLPIAAWFSVSFYLTPAPIDKYIAVSLFLLLAYVYRTRLILSSVLLGLAASTQQLSWIVIPFFYVMTLRESGKAGLVKSIAITLGIFLIINSYFIVLSPYKTVGNIFSLLFAKLQFSGPSFVQLLITFYQVPYWYITFVTVLIMISSLLLFYFYTDTLRPLIAIVPIAFFFFSWRNLSSYVSVLVPLLLVVYYFQKTDKINDIAKSKRPILYAFISVIIIAAVVLVYTHSVYKGSGAIDVTQIRSIIAINNQTGKYTLSGISVNVSNKMNTSEPILFYIVTRDPDSTTYAPSSLSKNLGPKENYTYALPINLTDFNSGTKLYIFAMSNTNTQGIELNARNG